jgi:hypothetical protein
MALRMLAFAFLFAAVDGSRLKHGRVRAHMHVSDKTMDALYPFYHTTSDIHTQLVQLSQNCPGMTLRQENGGSDSLSMDVVNIKAAGSQPVNKNFYLFGEHARELISPETGLELVKTLCGQNPSMSDKARDTLKDSEFEIVVNGNPNSRSKVEQGDFCLRVNQDGVDLNRNWDEKWQPNPDLAPADTNPGPSPFSEPETRVFKKIVSEYEPTNFLTIHSGTRGMYMPWAYDMEHLATRNQPEMMNILRKLDTDHCECPFGAAGKEVGYPCPGTCLDWVYDQLQTPYSFAFEIFIGDQYDEGLAERFHEKMQEQNNTALLQTQTHLAHSKFHSIFKKNPSDFVQLRSNAHHEHNIMGMDAMDCFNRFNPDSEDQFHEVVHNWVDAYLDLANMVSTNLKRDAGAPQAPSTPSTPSNFSFAFMG